jgi:hypothetical protein
VQSCPMGSLTNNLHSPLLLIHDKKNLLEFSRDGSPFVFVGRAVFHVLRITNIHDDHKDLFHFVTIV